MRIRLEIEFECPEMDDGDELFSCVDLQLRELWKERTPFATTGEEEPIFVSRWNSKWKPAWKIYHSDLEPRK